MKRSDSVILMVLPLVALVVGFWLLILAPKRHEASKLSGEVSKLQSAVDEQKRLAASAAEAKRTFPDNYEKVIEMGRAVPQDDDTASLVAQFSRLSKRSGVEFRSIELDSSQAQAAATVAATPPPSSESGGQQGESSQSTPTSSTAPAPTETTAATLPIGAGIGPAGFPVMPYKLEFRGDFFRVADFIHGLDQMVTTSNGVVAVHGRLLTIDGFNLKQNPVRGFPSLTAQFSITTYLTPSAQGLSAGATPEGPGAAPASTQPTTAPTTGAPAPTPTSAPAPAPGG